jgi:hypothetical protein
VCPIPAQDSSPGPFSGWGAERVPHLRRSDGEPGQAGSSSIDTQPFRVCVRTHSSHKTLTPGRVPHVPTDFLWSLLALANFMRLSLLKAAHVVVGWGHVREIRVAPAYMG